MVKPRQRGNNVVTLCDCPRACHVSTCARVACCRTMLPLFADLMQFYDLIICSDWLTIFTNYFCHWQSTITGVSKHVWQWGLHTSCQMSLACIMRLVMVGITQRGHVTEKYFTCQEINRYNCENWKQVQLLYHTEIHLFEEMNHWEARWPGRRI